MAKKSSSAATPEDVEAARQSDSNAAEGVALVPYEEMERGLTPEDLTATPPPAPPDAPAGTGEGPEAPNEFIRLSVWAQLKSIGGSVQTNGNTYKARFEIDAFAAGDTFELLGQETFKVVYGKVECGEARVKALSGKTDSEAQARAEIDLEWAANQQTPVGRLWSKLGKGAKLELESVQLGLDLTTKA
jgi:hypothetical protein